MGIGIQGRGPCRSYLSALIQQGDQLQASISSFQSQAINLEGILSLSHES